ncbi:hypothetical protein MRB53_015297 [Persea americana]|uniref:Uncharacterized protein n=1 Tax=Persea americana TaxID=3435 RepID=A0ACC2KDE7_PERAE|nr:hypothetical protein MRB53_015297 [Persea americana]
MGTHQACGKGESSSCAAPMQTVAFGTGSSLQTVPPSFPNTTMTLFSQFIFLLQCCRSRERRCRASSHRNSRQGALVKPKGGVLLSTRCKITFSDERYRLQPMMPCSQLLPAPLSNTEGETPSSDLILYDKENHISTQLILEQEIEALTFIAIDPQWDEWKLTPKMRAYIKMTGLEHLAKLKKCRIDYPLINALVERW